MSLTAAEVAQIMRLVEQSGFDELNLEIDGVKLSLRRGAPMQGAAPPAASAGPAAAVPGASAAPGAAAQAGGRGGRTPLPPGGEAGSPTTKDPNLHEVVSPLLGTFYRAPKPGAPSFVEVGTPVEEDTVVAIIEVMKLMNTVRAGIRGTVAEILVADGALAEFGEPLLRVRKAG